MYNLQIMVFLFTTERLVIIGDHSRFDVGGGGWGTQTHEEGENNG